MQQGHTPFVHLHAHCENSALDGLSTVPEMVAAITADSQEALALTDHGTCAGHPALQIAAKESGIKPIYGIELYLVNDSARRTKRRPSVKDYEAKELYDQALAAHKLDSAEVKDYWHLIVWAETDEGLKNLWALTTTANRDGFYGHPRADWDMLDRYSTGVMASTACLRGPLSGALLAEDELGEQQAKLRMGKLLSIYPDRLWVELHTNHLPQQKILNTKLAELANEYSLPMIAASDSHYPCKEDRGTHEIWLAVQTNTDLSESGMFGGGQDYHLQTGAEVRDALAYLPAGVVDEAVSQTVEVAKRCNANIVNRPFLPLYTKKGSEAERAIQDADRLMRMTLGNWSKINFKSYTTVDYEQRFEREMRLIISKRLCGYYLMVADYCQWAKKKGILVGPSRGSGGSSLVAYLADITEIDPLEAELLFERFLTEGRTALPDFDIDFPTSKREEIEQHIVERYGADHVVRVGTHLRLKNKGIIKDLTRVFKDQLGITYPEGAKISKIIDKVESSSAGLGVSWDQLLEDADEELRPYYMKYPLLFETAGKMVGRLKSYGKHAAGVVISPDESLAGWLPMRVADGQPVSEFDMEALDALGMPKFDFLFLRTLDTVQQCVDLVRERHGVVVSPYGWRDEYDDPAVGEMIGAGHTKGIFQIETDGCTQIAKRLKPRTVRDLADVITLVRPGPMRSGLTEHYLRRREGTEAVSYVDDRMQAALAKTQGTVIYQEQILSVCNLLAGYSMEQADEVRKILGKKKVALVQSEGERFVPACVERGMTQEAASQLWSQLAEFSRYAFALAHAYAYAILGWWTAWLKVYYPVEFIASVLSTVKKERIPEFVAEARRMGVKVLPPDINESQAGFSPVGDDTVRYGFGSVKGVGAKALEPLLAGQPYTSWEDFLERKGRVGTDAVALLVASGAFDSFYPNRHELEVKLTRKVSGEDTRCTFWSERGTAPNDLPCVFDWASEPLPIGKSGKTLKALAVPKRCTIRCRNYSPPDPAQVVVKPYTDVQVRKREQELFGVYLSSSPFDSIPADVMAECASVDSIENGPVAQYTVVGTVVRAKAHVDRRGRNMGFLDLHTPTGPLNMVCFADQWGRYERDLRKDTLIFATINKGGRGLSLDIVLPVNGV